MADAQDFTPNEAEIEVNEAYFQTDVKNLVSNEDIESFTKGCVSDYEARFKGQRAEWDEETTGIWNLQDAMWRSGLNDSAVQSQKHRGANEPDQWERAKTGSTLFYRQVRQKASNGYAVQTSRDVPFKYDAISSSEFDKAEYADARADKLNLLAKWSMKNDKFGLKCIDFWTQVYKYGNVPVMVEWVQEMGKKVISEPVFEPGTNNITDTVKREIDTAIVNRPTFNVLPVESLYADTAIGNIQDQECVIVSTVVSMTDLIDGVRSGIYREDLIELIGRTQQWDGSSGGYDNQNNKKNNRGMEREPTNSGTGQYLKREIFVNMPIDDEKETWDEMKNIPKRFRVTMFGNTPNSAIVARVERNQEPDDTIPIEMIHANPDDGDLLYHISDYEVIRSNIATETTLIRQTLDNNTLVNKPPQWEVAGAVEGNDRSFGPEARWIVDDPNSIGFIDVRDLSQTNIQLLQYIKEDSNTANAIDKNMVGESFGARTTASEATTISGNSRRPNVVNIEYILQQFVSFYAQRLKVSWEAYGRHDQIIQITDDNENRHFIKPTGISGEFDIVVDVVDDMKDEEVKAQRLINGATTFANNPQLSGQVDWALMASELAESIFGTDKFIVPAQDGDAVATANNNLVMMLQHGQPPQLTPDMNLAKHLEVYKEARQQWKGYEDQNPNIQVLDNAIGQLEQMVAQQNQGGGQQAPQGLPQAQAQLQQQLTSGALGGVQ